LVFHSSTWVSIYLTTWRRIPSYLSLHEKPFTSVVFSIENLPSTMNYNKRTVKIGKHWGGCDRSI